MKLHKTKKLHVVRNTRIKIRDPYALIRDRVDAGVMGGLRHATKHGRRDLEDEGDLSATVDDVVNQVMGELCDLLDFGFK